MTRKNSYSKEDLIDSGLGNLFGVEKGKPGLLVAVDPCGYRV
jgi:hypothetical protein